MNNKFLKEENNEWVVYERQIISAGERSHSRLVKLKSFNSKIEAEEFMEQSK